MKENVTLSLVLRWLLDDSTALNDAYIDAVSEESNAPLLVDDDSLALLFRLHLS